MVHHDYWDEVGDDARVDKWAWCLCGDKKVLMYDCSWIKFVGWVTRVVNGWPTRGETVEEC